MSILSTGVAAQLLPVLDPETFSEESDEDSLSPQSGNVTILDSNSFQPIEFGPDDLPGETFENREALQPNALQQNIASRGPPALSEFENYVSDVTGRDVPRFGASLLLPESRDFALPSTATVPPDYPLNVGDIVFLNLTGSLSGMLEREIDNEGNIFLPGVGPVMLAGVKYAQLGPTVKSALGLQYRQFDVSVGIRQLRGIRVYVTGFANNPGVFSVNSLSTLTTAVMQAGGPASGGSFRSVKVYRNGSEVADFDLYDILRGGDRTGDIVLQNEDVLFIPPTGRQAAVIGSVAEEAIFEFRDGETLLDLVDLAGGPNNLSDSDRLILYRTSDEIRRGAIEIPEFAWSASLAADGDIVQLLSKGTLVQPISRRSVVVRVEGEVLKPGNYHVEPNTPMQDILELAGGPTERAFLFGTRLERRSVRQQQSRSYQEAIEQLEFALASAPLVGSTEASSSRRQVELASAREVLELLRGQEPDGRVVMGLTPNSTSLPLGLLVEPEDRLLVPAQPSTVGVFGAVFRPASFLLETDQLSLGEYIEMAGGLQRAADKGRIFAVRANGEVLTKRNGMLRAQALPGDIVFVPIRTQSNDILQKIRDITAIIFQLGVTAAAVNSL